MRFDKRLNYLSHLNFILRKSQEMILLKQDLIGQLADFDIV